MQSRDNPLKALCMMAGLISVMVLVTILISTAMFLRNSKSNRIMPARRIIRRRKREPPQSFNFSLNYKSPFSHPDNAGGALADEDPEGNAGRNVESAGSQNINLNNNSPRPKPPPPSAPRPPPPPASNYRPSERVRPVPTISGSLASTCSRKSRHDSENSVSSALVSELKMKLEQKILEANQGGYYH